MSMFGNANKDKKPNSPIAALPSGGNDKDANVTTIIAKGTLIEGKFSCAENVRLDGSIHGEVKAEKRFVMGETGYVQGNILAREASIKGRIKGDINCKDGLHLLDSAIIEGNITARTMIVDEGARYSGSCKIGDVAGGNQPKAAN